MRSADADATGAARLVRLPRPRTSVGAGHQLDRAPAHALGKVAVVGLGTVGLPLAVRAAEVGYDVVGLEIDARKLQALREIGRAHV